MEPLLTLSNDHVLLQTVDKKANIVGIKTLSDTERAQLRAAK
jgi:hypothetical protein